MRIDVRGLNAGYAGDVMILNNVSLVVEGGSFVTVLGPNGSGKSTLLKAIMGYVRPASGEICVDGKSLYGVPVYRRSIEHRLAYVPQLNNVFGALTVRENLELGGAQLSWRERRRRIAELVELYPLLGERMRQRADSQSGGERQMLAIARALMTRPRCLLLDEPSAGLAPLMVEKLFELLADLHTREGVTLLVAEQNVVQSLEASDRGVVLVQGQIVFEASARDLLEDARLSELYLGGAPELASARPSRGM